MTHKQLKSGDKVLLMGQICIILFFEIGHDGRQKYHLKPSCDDSFELPNRIFDQAELEAIKTKETP